MAKIEKANIDGRIESAVNISGVVGFGGINLRDDVMLIQGLFRYIAEGLFPGAVGLGGSYKIPEITGTMDADTYSAIGEFQIRNAAQLLMKTYDGKINPASYRNRRLNSNGRQMSIVCLHLMASNVAHLNGEFSYISGLGDLTPELGSLIDRMVIS